MGDLPYPRPPRDNVYNKDHHSLMKTSIFEDWFRKMFYQLEKAAIIVMDNAPYHSALVEDCSKSNRRKADVQQWLKDKIIDFSSRRNSSSYKKKSDIRKNT